MVTWAGYDHLEQATALAGYYTDVKDREGWEPDRLVALLAALDQLVPWLRQWHNEVDPDFDQRMGDFYAAFVEGEARELEKTVDELRAWEPPKTAKRARKRTKKSTKNTKDTPEGAK